ncbi:balbiani ring protein 3 [Alligator mississippiensis]|uniref:Balbiani ring protein 3 n=1 Tax=Alligator mississippiensis TaxID=8496 RepID=A0A151NZR2_ALLMI|nr:balbiani ring protein 3 [Alligator mississippiensis]
MESGTVLLLLLLLLTGVLAQRAELSTVPDNEKGAITKRGECPPDSQEGRSPSCLYCLLDESCPGMEKCCSDGGMRACVLPPTVHPGYCPQPEPGLVTTCLVNCVNDTECGPGEKCCVSGCHRKCAPAEPARPGTCPQVTVHPGSRPCQSRCEDDRTCPENQKCCFTGCGLKCVDPQWDARSIAQSPAPTGGDWSGQQEGGADGKPQKPGTCPADPIRCIRSFPPLCQVDADCPEMQKCCYKACQFHCVLPGDTCQLPVQKGLCDAYSRRFFFNATAARCQDFLYSGCRGNANNFRTREECVQTCEGQEEPSPGPVPVAGGCERRCLYDHDCARGEKCCSLRCRRECVDQSSLKRGYCSITPGLYFTYNCKATCRADGECPGDEKCCLQGCDYKCLTPSKEKPGICPLAAPTAPCTHPCGEDDDCPGDRKCCQSSCGQTCLAPDRAKPGECPKVRPWQTLVPCEGNDTCTHDRDCPKQEKCCFSGCFQHCLRRSREHPGMCPKPSACDTPEERHHNQCLEDSICQGHEKCCDTGCAWECVAVRKGAA